MHCTRNLSQNIVWVGGMDRRLNLFENLFPIPRGIAYNAYLIRDEKTCLMDTVDSSIRQQFIDNIYHVLQGRDLDYIVINHMEPDHCANIEELMIRFPKLKIIGNRKTLTFVSQFYDMDLHDRTITVNENDTFSLGIHTLRFIMTPMVHWPEVMMTYEESENILFSADAFGSFGAANGNLFDGEVDYDGEWLGDARRYFANIVGKYGPQVQTALKKTETLDIRMIAPLHGVVWRDNITYIVQKYKLWSTYTPEQQTVTIFYGSMYGNTENTANILGTMLAEKGIRNIQIYDVSNTDVSLLIAEIFRCSHIVLAAPTYNNEIYPEIFNLLHDMKILHVQNRVFGIIENGTWGALSARQITNLLQDMKGMEILEPKVTVTSSLKKDSLHQVSLLADSILQSLHTKVSSF